MFIYTASICSLNSGLVVDLWLLKLQLKLLGLFYYCYLSLERKNSYWREQTKTRNIKFEKKTKVILALLVQS